MRCLAQRQTQEQRDAGKLIKEGNEVNKYNNMRRQFSCPNANTGVLKLLQLNQYTYKFHLTAWYQIIR